MTWLSPLFDYGSCIWIFRLYRTSTLHYSCEVDGGHDGYKSIFKKLNTLYMGYMRNILVVPDSTSHLAVLVRLGVMPLNYMLAYRSAIWYLKLIRGLCGPALLELYHKFLANDEAFGSTTFFKPVRDFIQRLNKYCVHVNLEKSKFTCSCYHSVAVGRGHFRSRRLSTVWLSPLHVDSVTVRMRQRITYFLVVQCYQDPE